MSHYLEFSSILRAILIFSSLDFFFSWFSLHNRADNGRVILGECYDSQPLRVTKARNYSNPSDQQFAIEPTTQKILRCRLSSVSTEEREKQPILLKAFLIWYIDIKRIISKSNRSRNALNFNIWIPQWTKFSKLLIERLNRKSRLLNWFAGLWALDD